MRKLPVSPFKIASTVGEVQSIMESPSRVLVTGADAEHLDKVVGALDGVDTRGASVIDSRVIEPGASLPPEAFSDSTAACIIVASTGELAAGALSDSLAKLDRKGRGAVVMLTRAPGFEMTFPGVGPGRVVGMSMDGTPPADLLAEAVVEAAGDQSVALAARLPALRDAACRHVIKKAARQNAVVGCIFFLPGADMPVMTLNEARMVLRLAAAHGEEVSVERALELLGVVGAGFGFRSIARQALDFMPGPGWLVKGAVAYGGTRALGSAARSYFNGEVRVTPSRLAPLVERLQRLRG